MARKGIVVFDNWTKSIRELNQKLDLKFVLARKRNFIREVQPAIAYAI